MRHGSHAKPGTRHDGVPTVAVLSELLTTKNFQQALHYPPPDRHFPQHSDLCDVMPAPCWPHAVLIPSMAAVPQHLTHARRCL